MSGMRHATISAWQRHEDGSYAAEINGWNLKVTWQPEKPGERRGFLWSAEREGSSKLAATEVSEEIELAMVYAEQAIETAGK
ncbi:Hypothetical protein A7982_09938 [Minicystis rosea]|nr:Hypothetical protein A7982_09938 [Minicystis rosea]